MGWKEPCICYLRPSICASILSGCLERGKVCCAALIAHLYCTYWAVSPTVPPGLLARQQVWKSMTRSDGCMSVLFLKRVCGCKSNCFPPSCNVEQQYPSSADIRMLIRLLWTGDEFEMILEGLGLKSAITLLLAQCSQPLWPCLGLTYVCCGSHILM